MKTPTITQGAASEYKNQLRNPQLLCHPTALDVEKKTTIKQIAPIIKNKTVEPVFPLGTRIPKITIATKITDKAIPILGKISEKNLGTKSNCKAIKPTTIAITAFKPLLFWNKSILVKNITK